MADFFEYIAETFFTMNTGEYENISESTLRMIPMLVFGLAIGAVIASISLTFTKRVLGDFVRGLIFGGCNSPENAKTLTELGYGRNTAIRSALRSNPVVKKFVRAASDDETKNGKMLIELHKVDVDNLKFYIDKEDCDRAEIRFEKKGTNPLGVILTVVVMIVIVIAALKFIPSLLEVIDRLLGAGSDNQLPPIKR